MSAWLLIALCRYAKGERDAAADVYRRLVSKHPRFFWDIARSLAAPWPPPADSLVATCEQGLHLMRGNRSSHTITYFDGDAVMRIVTDAEALSREAAKRAHLIERAVLDRLAS
jgi:hypothetical protein